MKVKLQDVLLALEEAGNDEISCCYSINKEKIVFFSEYFDDDEEEHDEDDDYIRLPDSYDINEYRMMENFVYSLPKGKNQTILYNAIQGRVPLEDLKINYMKLVWQMNGISIVINNIKRLPLSGVKKMILK